MRLLPTSLSALALAALAVPVVGASAASTAPETILASTPTLYTVRGDVPLGRPTGYVTFRTAKAISARLLIVTVSGSSGRTFTVIDGRNRRAPRSRTCFRSAMNPYQPSPATPRFKPGVAYKVRFYVRPSLKGERTLFATRTLRAHSFAPQMMSGGGFTGPPSPCTS